MARGKPLATFGNAKNAPEEKLTDLREEAVARLKAYRDRPSDAGYVPRYLLQMQSDQKHAIVIDTQKARLYLYQNDNGRPRFVADYYISYGKLGAGKMREGDKRTPTGVYHVTSSLSTKKLGDFYGSGAFPINYPNEWDKRQGRNGYGIWLHGTPSDTYSRPPKASDGCVVLSNADLNALAKNLQIGLTPVIISNSIEWLSHDDWQNERTGLNKKIDEWRADWEAVTSAATSSITRPSSAPRNRPTNNSPSKNARSTPARNGSRSSFQTFRCSATRRTSLSSSPSNKTTRATT